jgi:hypothetical protein
MDANHAKAIQGGTHPQGFEPVTEHAGMDEHKWLTVPRSEYSISVSPTARGSIVSGSRVMIRCLSWLCAAGVGNAWHACKGARDNKPEK